MAEHVNRTWRDEMDEQRALCEKLDAFAKEKLPGIPFCMRWHWTHDVALDWIVWDETLQEFCARVKRVSALIGPPDVAEAGHWLGQYTPDAPPDLTAEWKIEHQGIKVRVLLRNLRAKGCKLHPGTPFKHEVQEQAIHPECAAVLAELTV